ncbi:hypothetical protein [Streptomyces marincola]|uniref:hypothetical protein n=1 Tax=Streptomyces marincola TaxID=2878388 RepID=UPI001CF4AD7E|nr:hypothetical protein [Streptomyces marincola]UCM87810.1 hypothetical protein LC193_07520 [Streptomyces marincola]
MIPDPTTFIQHPSGPMHTGGGDQFNAAAYYSVSFHLSKEGLLGPSTDRRPAATVAAEYLRWLTARFVAPPGYGRAQELLERHPALTLVGDNGTGRRTAALMLLRALRPPGGRLTEVTTAGQEAGEQSLDPNEVEKGDSVLLDLTGVGRTTLSAALTGLPAYCSAVESLGSRLVVVLPQPDATALPSGAPPLAVRLGRPDEYRVLQRHLGRAGLRGSVPELARHLPRNALATRSMSALAHLAALIEAARDSGRSTHFATWCVEGLRASTPWQAETLEKIIEHRTGNARALLFASAMLHGASGDVVFAATRILRQVMEQPSEQAPPLEHTDLAEELKEISARLDGDGRVRFDALAFDEAVRFHFWTHRPDLRGRYRTWVERTIRKVDADQEERQHLVARFAEGCIRTGRLGDLVHTATKWTQDGEKTALMADAANALARGVQSETSSAWFLRRIYEWSRQQHLPGRWRTVLTQICAEVVLRSHPKQALVRLRHLARSEFRVGTTAARDALRDAVRTDDRLWRWLLDRLVQSPEANGKDLDAVLFLHLADPDRWLGAAIRPRFGLAAQLAAGWRVAFARLPRAQWARHEEQWLDGCSGHHESDRVLNVLVTAADRDARRLAEIYDTAKTWAYRSPEEFRQRLAIIGRLQEMIDIAQETAGAVG